MTKNDRGISIIASDLRSRRDFLTLVVQGAAIATIVPLTHTVNGASAKQVPKPWDLHPDEDRFLRLRAIIDEAIRSGDRAKMLTEASALGLPPLNMLALESVTVDHLCSLSSNRCDRWE